MSNSTVKMKLLIDNSNKSRRVIFAEASKECVDFLFHILSLPVATVIRLLREEGMCGSLPKLYKSLECLNGTYIEPGRSKDAYLKPAAPPVSGSLAPLLALECATPVDQKKFYSCGSCNNDYHYSRSIKYVSDDPSAKCPSHNQSLSYTLTYVAPPATVNVVAEGGGLVKGVVTYMVMDDLTIKPMSTISSIAMLNNLNVKDVGALEEKVVNLGMKEAIKLLKTSLESDNVLTDLFC